jgi:hypothetical protein
MRGVKPGASQQRAFTFDGRANRLAKLPDRSASDRPNGKSHILACDGAEDWVCGLVGLL